MSLAWLSCGRTTIPRPREILPVEFTLRLTRTLRRLVAERATRFGVRAQELLRGLSRSGEPMQDPHVAWLALPFVGNRHARHPDKFFGRSPRSDSDREKCRRAEDEVKEAIKSACANVELPRPQDVFLSSVSPIVGTAPAHRFPLSTDPHEQCARIR
jgi:hypothetical protein